MIQFFSVKKIQHCKVSRYDLSCGYLETARTEYEIEGSPLRYGSIRKEGPAYIVTGRGIEASSCRLFCGPIDNPHTLALARRALLDWVKLGMLPQHTWEVFRAERGLTD